MMMAVLSFLSSRLGRLLALILAILIAVGTFGASMRRSGRKAAEREYEHRKTREYIETRRRIDDAMESGSASDARAAFERVRRAGGFKRGRL